MIQSKHGTLMSVWHTRQDSQKTKEKQKRKTKTGNRQRTVSHAPRTPYEVQRETAGTNHFPIPGRAESACFGACIPPPGAPDKRNIFPLHPVMHPGGRRDPGYRGTLPLPRRYRGQMVTPAERDRSPIATFSSRGCLCFSDQLISRVVVNYRDKPRNDIILLGQQNSTHFIICFIG